MTQEEIQSERKKRSVELRKRREETGIGQRAFAKLSGLSWPTIVRIEGGKKEWRVDSELMYLAALNSLNNKDLAMYR